MAILGEEQGSLVARRGASPLHSMHDCTPHRNRMMLVRMHPRGLARSSQKTAPVQSHQGWSFTYWVSSLSFLARKTWLASFSLQYRRETQLVYYPQEQKDDLLKEEQGGWEQKCSIDRGGRWCCPYGSMMWVHAPQVMLGAFSNLLGSMIMILGL